MNNRRLVYTCIASGYDRVYPPLSIEEGFDYFIVTDDPTLTVPGWRIHIVDRNSFPSSRLMNRYFKMLGHREFLGYDASLYVDGNIRILGGLQLLFDRFQASGGALRLFAHPLRDTVSEEIEACVKGGKVSDGERLLSELAAYRTDGFADVSGLIEATILMKDHTTADTDRAMCFWWDLYQQYQSRDQISLPYVLWKTGVSYTYHDFSFRQPNPFFGLYPHWKAAYVPALYTHLSARSHDSVVHWLLQQAWHSWWEIRRWIRSARKP
jgi:hypothetical protein